MKKKITVIIAIADAVLLIIFGAALLYAGRMTASVSTKQAAELWKSPDSETNYAAISLFTDENSAMDILGIYNMRTEVKKKIEEQIAGLEGKYSCDTWYGIKSAYFSGPLGSGSVKVFYTGGDYFNIRNAEVISGSVYTGDTANIDMVVLDDYSSWKLFGALDTAGMKVTSGDMEFTVAAVIRSPDSKNKELKAAYDDDATSMVYMPYEAACVLFGGEQRFTAYETIIPDQIKGFAEGILRSAASCEQDTSSKKIYDGNTRFDIDKIQAVSKKISSFTDSGAAPDFPFYEDAAQAVMLKLGIMYKIFFPVFVILFLSACFWLVRFVELMIFVVRKIYRFFDDKSDKKKLENYYKTHPKIIIKEIDEGESR